MKLHQDVPHGTAGYPFQVHETRCNEGLYLYPHVHPEYELTVITKGHGSFFIEGKEYLVREGDCIFISPNIIHLATHAQNGEEEKNIPEEADFFSIVFLPQCFGAERDTLIYTKYVAPFLRGNLRVLPVITSNIHWHSEILGLAIDIKDSYFSGQSELLCQSLMLKLWNVLYENAQIQDAPDVDHGNSLLKDTMDYMEEHYPDHITVEDLAARIGLSPSYFSKLYQRYMHISPIESLIQLRLQHSAKQLLSTSEPVGEIALQCGFNDFSYFSKRFRKRYGCSPREYRELQNNGEL